MAAAEIDNSLQKPTRQEIGVTPEMELIWGYRRLLATRDVLKRDEILCRDVAVNSNLQGEIDENTLRKDFTPSELVAIVDTLRGYAHGGDRKSDQDRKCDVDHRLTTIRMSCFTATSLALVVMRGIGSVRFNVVAGSPLHSWGLPSKSILSPYDGILVDVAGDAAASEIAAGDCRREAARRASTHSEVS